MDARALRSYSTHWLTACTISPTVGVSSSELIRCLAGELIEARPLWKPMHAQPVFGRYRYFPDRDGSVSDRLFEQGICLPSGSNMLEGQIQRIVSVIRKAIVKA